MSRHGFTKPHFSFVSGRWRCLYRPSYWLPRYAVGWGETPRAAYWAMFINQPVAQAYAVLGAPVGVLP